MGLIKVQLETAKLRAFEGYVESSDLNDAQLKILGLTRESAPETINASGEYHVQWDNDNAVIIVDYLIAYSVTDDTVYNVVDLSDQEANFPHLEEQISNSGNDLHWLADRVSAEEDYSWDR